MVEEEKGLGRRRPRDGRGGRGLSEAGRRLRCRGARGDAGGRRNAGDGRDLVILQNTGAPHCCAADDTGGQMVPPSGPITAVCVPARPQNERAPRSRRGELEAELRSPPVPPLVVVADLAVRLHAEPVDAAIDARASLSVVPRPAAVSRQARARIGRDGSTRTHQCGIGLFWFAFLASFILILNVFWLGCLSVRAGVKSRESERQRRSRGHPSGRSPARLSHARSTQPAPRRARNLEAPPTHDADSDLDFAKRIEHSRGELSPSHSREREVTRERGFTA